MSSSCAAAGRRTELYEEVCLWISVLTDITAPPGPGPRSHGPFSLRKCQLETGNLHERKKKARE